MKSDTAFGILILVLCVIFLAIGVLIGLQSGSDSIANEWCSSLGYASGYHSNTSETSGLVVCKHAAPVEVEGEG